MAYDPASKYRVEIDEAPLIRDEVRDVVALGPEERVKILASVCRSGAQLMQIKGEADRRRVLDFRDPISPGAEAAIARLRQRYQARR